MKKSSGITDLPSLKGKKLGVQTDTTGQAYADKNKDANGYETVVFDDLPTEIAGVQSGRVDGAINDNGPLLDFTKANPDFQVVKEFDTGEQYGFLFQKDDANAAKIKGAFERWVWTDSDRAERLVRLYNDAFNSLVPRHFSGEHLQLPGA